MITPTVSLLGTIGALTVIVAVMLEHHDYDTPGHYLYLASIPLWAGIGIYHVHLGNAGLAGLTGFAVAVLIYER